MAAFNLFESQSVGKIDHWKAMDVKVRNQFLVPFILCCLLTASVPLKFFFIIFPCVTPLSLIWYLNVSAERWCFLPQNGFSFWGPSVTCLLSRNFGFDILKVLFHIWADSHRVPGRGNTNLGVISNFLTEFFITLWKHSHVRTVDECNQDECGPFHACRKEGSWERLSIATLWAFQGGMNGVIVARDHLEAIAGRGNNEEQCSQIWCALACVGTRSRDSKYIAKYNCSVKNNAGLRSPVGDYWLTRTFIEHADEEKDFGGCSGAVNRTQSRPSVCGCWCHWT